MKREFIVTEDGSHTLYVPELKEHYHSTHGAVQESNHVFIEAGLSQLTDRSQVNILEIGLGTGLNALLTANYSVDKDLKISYNSIEKYPISSDEIANINYRSEDPNTLFDKLHEVNWSRSANSKERVTDLFEISKIEGDFKNISTFNLKDIDLVYFDAFAPDIQPDLWTIDIFRSIFTTMREHSILVTYCAKGVVRRTLQEVGFTVERIPGPPGKREMLRARK